MIAETERQKAAHSADPSLQDHRRYLAARRTRFDDPSEL
jgi:hypothetical protein